MTKKCFRCRRAKPIVQFYKHKQMADGHLNKCKTCTRKDVRRRYYDPASRPKVVEYERLRAQSPQRKLAVAEYQRSRRKLHPGKNRARQAVNNAIRDNRIEKGVCEVCGEKKVEAHHADYRQPLNVKWLCRKHHLLEENKVPYNL